VSPPLVEARGLGHAFGERVVLRGVELRVEPGTSLALFGPNGAGKSTLLRALAGLVRPLKGEALLDGTNASDAPPALRRRVGYVGHRPLVWGGLTARENLLLYARLYGVSEDAVDGQLARVGLAGRGDDLARELSQGMRQRLGLARCLLADPELLILDEPTNGLDPHGIHEIRGIVAALVGEGRTVLVSSHLLDEIEKTCQAAAVIDNGRLIAQGPIGTLLRAAHPQFEVGCDAPATAAARLAGHPAVVQVRPVPAGVRLTLREPGAISAINALLVGGGVVVTRIAPVTSSLEERFLQHTTKIGSDR
jgi:ABC-2 type transport system ATP-binding protein